MDKKLENELNEFRKAADKAAHRTLLVSCGIVAVIAFVIYVWVWL